MKAATIKSLNCD